jgi:peptide chain release factor subunit 1
MQQFLYDVVHDTGMITYGEEEVRRSLEGGAVRTLLLSEGLDVRRVIVKCTVCGHQEQHSVKGPMMVDFEQSLQGKPCPKCKNPTLVAADSEDLIEDFARLAEYTNSDVEIVSGETEEGQMLKNSFGGVAAILRFKSQTQ